MRSLAEQTYDRTKQLTTRDFASVQKLDEATATLDVARRSREQAKLALDEAIAGYTAEERGVAQAAVVKAEAAIATLKAQVAELTVKAPVAAQVYETSAEVGEYVSPGVPLLSLVDLSDVWLRFDLREDLAQGPEGRRPLRGARAGAGRQGDHRRRPPHRDARRVCRLARHARDRRLRPPDLRDPRLSRRAGARPAAGHERLRRLEEAPDATAAVRPARRHGARARLAVARPRRPGPGGWRAVARHRRTLAHLQQRRHPRPQGRRRRPGPDARPR